MEQLNSLNGLFKTVFYRVIFNSLVGLIAVIVVSSFYLFLSNQNSNNLYTAKRKVSTINSNTKKIISCKSKKIYTSTNNKSIITDKITNISKNFLQYTHLNNILIFIIFITVLGEVIIALGETIVHHFPFKYNAIVNDVEMETVTPSCFNCDFSNNQLRSFKYKDFLSIFDDKNGIIGDFSEINFVIGGVFAGLGYIFMTVSFYLIFNFFNKSIFLYILYGSYIILIVFFSIIILYCIINKLTKFYEKDAIKNCNFLKQKDSIINFLMLIISILISATLSYLLNLYTGKAFEILTSLNILLLLVSLLITLFLFYQSILHISFANQINCAMINENENSNSSQNTTDVDCS